MGKGWSLQHMVLVRQHILMGKKKRIYIQIFHLSQKLFQSGNVEHKTIKQLENIGENLDNHRFDTDFLDIAPKAVYETKN